MTGLDVSRNNLYMYVFNRNLCPCVCVCKTTTERIKATTLVSVVRFCTRYIPHLSVRRRKYLKINTQIFTPDFFLDIHTGIHGFFSLRPLVGYLQSVSGAKCNSPVLCRFGIRSAAVFPFRPSFAFAFVVVSATLTTILRRRRVHEGRRRRSRNTSNKIDRFSLWAMFMKSIVHIVIIVVLDRKIPMKIHVVFTIYFRHDGLPSRSPLVFCPISIKLTGRLLVFLKHFFYFANFVYPIRPFSPPSRHAKAKDTVKQNAWFTRVKALITSLCI